GGHGVFRGWNEGAVAGSAAGFQSGLRERPGLVAAGVGEPCFEEARTGVWRVESLVVILFILERRSPAGVRGPLLGTAGIWSAKRRRRLVFGAMPCLTIASMWSWMGPRPSKADSEMDSQRRMLRRRRTARLRDSRWK